MSFCTLQGQVCETAGECVGAYRTCNRPSAPQAKASGFPKDSGPLFTGHGLLLQVRPATASPRQGEEVLRSLQTRCCAGDVPAEGRAPTALFFPPPSGRRPGVGRLVECNLSSPVRSGCPLTSATAFRPAAPSPSRDPCAHLVPAQLPSGKGAALRLLPPLRTGLESFPSSGSSHQ